MLIEERAKTHLLGGTFRPGTHDVRIADQLLAGKITIRSTKAVNFTDTFDWEMDPYSDNNWKFQLHSMRWTDPLRRAWISTGKDVYREKYSEYLKSWCESSLMTSRAKSYAWYDMAAGTRVMILAAAISIGLKDQWVLDALRIHGERLAKPGFGAQTGNHALHVKLGLLVVSHLLENKVWQVAAEEGIENLFYSSINHEGVDFEGGIQYQRNNYVWYKEALQHLEAATGTAPGFAGRLELMPRFLAHSSNSTGLPVQYGDSDPVSLAAIKSPELEFISSRGVSGSAPNQKYISYEAGYTFGRTHWNFENNESMMFYSLRHGPAYDEQPHADHDAGSITLTLGDRELLFESGRYQYDKHKMSRYLNSNSAHNSVVIEGDDYDASAKTLLLASVSDEISDWTLVSRQESKGSVWRRGVFHLREARMLIVVDRIDTHLPTAAHQHWQLPADAKVVHTNTGAQVVSRDGSALSMAFASNINLEREVISGQEPILLGWRSTKYGSAFPAPILRVGGHSRAFNLITVLAPSTGAVRDIDLQSSKSLLDSDINSEELTISENGKTIHFIVTANENNVSIELAKNVSERVKLFQKLIKLKK